MAGESCVTRSNIDELHSSEIQGYQMEGESGITRTIIDELLCLYIEGDQMEVERAVTRSIIDELHSSDTTKRKVKVVLLEVSLINIILWISKEI